MSFVVFSSVVILKAREEAGCKKYSLLLGVNLRNKLLDTSKLLKPRLVHLLLASRTAAAHRPYSRSSFCLVGSPSCNSDQAPCPMSILS